MHAASADALLDRRTVRFRLRFAETALRVIKMQEIAVAVLPLRVVGKRDVIEETQVVAHKRWRKRLYLDHVAYPIKAQPMRSAVRLKNAPNAMRKVWRDRRCASATPHGAATIVAGTISASPTTFT